MTTYNYQSQQNGTVVHYYANSGEVCHPSIIVGNSIQTDGFPTSADIIQLDALSLGVVVPLRRNGVNFNEAIDTNGTIHYGSCSRT